MSDSWMDDPERFVKPDPFVDGHLVISDRDPGDENDNECCGCGGCSNEGRVQVVKVSNLRAKGDVNISQTQGDEC